MSFCKYCGSEHDEDAVFCTECGKPTAKKAGPVIHNAPQVASQECITSATAVVPPKVTHAATTPPKKKIGKILVCIAVCIVIILIVFTILNPKPFSKDAVAIEAADASVVTIFCYDYNGELAATGSGFIAFDGKTVVTNYHVMASAYTCKISTNQDFSFDVLAIHCYSKEHDIAILKLAEDTGLQPLTLGDSTTIKKGETVVAIGSPLGIKNTVSTGVLSGRLMEDGMDVLQFTAPISSGSSGGALFDDNGRIIGITFASIIDGQNLNLAIPIELANDLYLSREFFPVSVATIYNNENADNNQRPEFFVDAVGKIYRLEPYGKCAIVRTVTLDDELTAEYLLAKMDAKDFDEKEIAAIMAQYGSGLDGKEGDLITPGEFVEELDEWCFASDREAGDIAIIKNVYGYTICYITAIYK